jgi:carotenoid cleavage dioxygenase
VFAPNPDGTAEDDGWLVNSMHNSDTGQSEVIVLDAQRVEDGPIARIQIPQRMPFGFHANWFSAE